MRTLLAGPSPIGRSLPATSHLKFQHTGARMCDGMIGGGIEYGVTQKGQLVKAQKRPKCRISNVEDSRISSMNKLRTYDDDGVGGEVVRVGWMGGWVKGWGWRDGEMEEWGDGEYHSP